MWVVRVAVGEGCWAGTRWWVGVRCGLGGWMWVAEWPVVGAGLLGGGLATVKRAAGLGRDARCG